MPADGLSIESVRVRDLPEFARAVESKRDQYGIAPITIARGRAHALNPAADPDRPGLFVAYLGHRCVGYLGLLPIVLDDRGHRIKVDCLSTLYVAPEHRQTGAGSLLVLRAMSLGRDLVAVGTSEAATRLLLALGFRRAVPTRILRIRIEMLLGLSFALGALARRLDGTPVRGFGAVLDASRGAVRRSIDVGLRRLLVRIPRRLVGPFSADAVVRPTSRLTGLTERDPASVPGRTMRFVRGEATINWMIANPWIAENDGRDSRYVFSHFRPLFRFLPFELRRRTEGESLGYVVLSISSQAGRTTLKILDHSLVRDGLRAAVLSIALREAQRWSADIVEASGEWWDLVAACPLLKLVTAKEERLLLAYTRDASGPLGARLGELEGGYCDGEAPYT